MSTQTIAAIATGLTNSGISIIRISGSNSLKITQKIFQTSAKLEPNKIVYGKIYKEDCMLDEVLVSYFKAPKSFTGEDICEINCHGGIQITRQILELVLEKGAILAEPGEFSKRAFLNGKMDLSQAEAMIQLIQAKSRTSARVSSYQLEGNLSKKITELREELLELLAQIEVSIDYPEYDYEEVEIGGVTLLLKKKIEVINQLLKTYEQGRMIQDGIRVAILGKPNVGKSSLLNTLANYDRAIVTDIPGTTRDVVEEHIMLGDMVLNIADTAGIRDTEDVVEKIGVERSLKRLDEVDFVIYMMSLENPFDADDQMVLSKIQNKGLKYVVLINKMDQYEKSKFDAFMEELKQKGIKYMIPISIYESKGIDEVKEFMMKTFQENDMDFGQELMITNERHKDLLKQAVASLNLALEEIGKRQPIDILFLPIQKATKSLGEIIGADVSEEVIEKIFEKFCLGK